MKFRQLSIATAIIFVSVNPLLLTFGVGFNETCTLKHDCNSTLGLHCQHGRGSSDKVCLCAPHSHYYPESGVCSYKLGGPCGRYARKYGIQLPSTVPRENECPPRAICVSVLEDIIPEEKLPIAVKIGNLLTSDTKCICDHQSMSIVSGTMPECVPFLKFGSKCTKKDKHHSCNFKQGMICGKTDTCECVDPMTFDTEFDRCVLPLHGHLEKKLSPHNLCGKNAILSTFLEELKYLFYSYVKRSPGYEPHRASKPSESQNTCVCFPGYSDNTKGECIKTLRGPCSDKSPCNKEQFLSCVDGMCQCTHVTMTTFTASSGCRLIPGAKCSLTEGPKCVDEAVCTDSQCQCKPGYSASAGGSTFCLLDHGSKCSSSRDSEQCNYLTGLACINGSCSCFDSFLKWNKIECVAEYEGSPCGNIPQTRESEQMDQIAYDFEEIITSSSSQIGEGAAREANSHKSMYVIGCAEGLQCMWHPYHHGRRCYKAGHN